jgi:hypothetical protein
VRHPGTLTERFAPRLDIEAGEATAEDVHRFDGAPVDAGDVTEVQRVGPVAGDGFVDLEEPDRLGVEDILDSQIESAVSRQQRPDPQTTLTRRGVVVHEGSGSSVTPNPSPSRRPVAGLITCQVHDPAWSPAEPRR